ncbi:MAG: hypothetical protein GY820_09830 [Gammaproteobacteria bacterium]|nr:hypothetical protein [Gammaproteobacteria bacterium]
MLVGDLGAPPTVGSISAAAGAGKIDEEIHKKLRNFAKILRMNAYYSASASRQIWRLRNRRAFLETTDPTNKLTLFPPPLLKLGTFGKFDSLFGRDPQLAA